MFISSVPHEKLNISYIGCTTTTLSHRLTYHLYKNSAIKQRLIIKHYNCTNQIISFGIRKILIDNTIFIYKNNSKKTLQIQ